MVVLDFGVVKEIGMFLGMWIGVEGYSVFE